MNKEFLNRKIKIALVDDHLLLRNALTQLINSFENYRVCYEVGNGKDLLASLENGERPDIVVLDLNMPVMDGYETLVNMEVKHPNIPVLMLTMYDSELSLIRLLNKGAKGFLKKDCHPDELKLAFRSIIEVGHFFSSSITGKMANIFHKRSKEELAGLVLSDVEISFLKLCCSELTYKEIAISLNLNPRQVDTLRDQLFLKFNVRSRVALAIITLRNGLISL